MRYTLTIFTKDNVKIKTTDEFINEDDAINQCQYYGVNGYYSRVLREYTPPYQISKIFILNE